MEINSISVVSGLREFGIRSPVSIRDNLTWAEAIPDGAHLNVREAADFLVALGVRVTPGTLNTWRCRRSDGPKYTKVHARVTYLAGDLRHYVDAARTAAA